MKICIKGIYRLFFVLAFFVFPLQVSALPISSLFVFGDSLSDSGNISIATGGTVQPVPFGGLVPAAAYASGRFTNGPVWVEQLAADLGVTANPAFAGGTNFAFGGARTGPLGAGAVPPTSPSLLDQFALFSSGTGGVAPSDALYVVWGGGNDVRDAAVLKQGGHNTAASAAIITAVNNIALTIGGLTTAGAHDILVPNLSDLGLNPESVHEGFASEASILSVEFNTLLGGALSGFSADPSINLMSLDIFALQASIFASPGSFGFSNTSDSCVGVSTVCSDPENFFFYDGVHPTTAGHAQIAALARATVVPEPSILLLLGAGFVGLFSFKRKNKSCA